MVGRWGILPFVVGVGISERVEMLESCELQPLHDLV